MYSYQKDLKNIFIWIIFFGTYILFSLSNNALLESINILLFLTFGSFIYGLWTQNPVKASLLGFLFPIITLTDRYLYDGPAEFQRVFWYFAVFSVMGLFAGFFAGVAKPDKNYDLICLFLSLFFAGCSLVHLLKGIN
ncbi:MAG: hypothetical protein LBU81_05885 [Methanosarcinales archaeon]|jgi:hypothetical protein|nr:hypothetical protein [Methanosarcinales archaeon]